MKIITVGSALPPYEYPQEELTNALAEYWEKHYFNVDRLRELHQNLHTESRRFCIPLEQFYDLESFEARNHLYIQNATELGTQAIENALAKVNLSPQQIDHLFFTSITGIAAPSIDARLINRLQMRSDIRRTPIFGLGCLGGAAGLSRAVDYVKAYPKHIAVLLSVELCSLTLQKQDLSIPNVISSGLFGDGAAAAVVAGAEVELDGIDVLKSHSAFYHDTEDVMGWDILDSGFKIILSAKVPQMVRDHAQQDLLALLDNTNLTPQQLQHYICHSGGPKVLEALEETLSLSKEDLRLSWQTLKQVGNLSSTSVLLVLEETMKQSIPPGDHGVLMAMGPGFCSEWLLLGW